MPSTSDSPFPTDSRGFRPVPSPATFRLRVHPLLSWSSSSEFVTAPCLLSVRRPRVPPVEFLSPSRHQQNESTSRRAFPCSTSVRPQRFSRSRRVTPRSALRAYFIPLPRAGFTSQGLSPSSSQQASSTCRPLLALASLPCRKPKLTTPGPDASPSGS